MSDVLISIRGLSKIYPLATSASQRLLYVLGLDRFARASVSTKAAVDDIGLDIRRGEKVGIIGRNGSGKSTLLRMISGVIEPTRGQVTVEGSVHALLELGAGFNEELTGRENAFSYLAMQGVTGKEAQQRVAQIAEFAEIGVYFDQPFKTYSSGMRLRLMFASATSITPDVLILDEVLSVGDAYFVGKSFERMRQLSAGDGTTLIVVSHAVNMLPELCDRLIWLDNGSIRMEGEPETVARAYDLFVRAEEENRLRKLQASTPIRQLDVLPGESDAQDSDVRFPNESSAVAGISGEIRLLNGQPPQDELIVQRIELYRAGVRIADIPMGPEARSGDGVLVLDRGAGNWGEFQSDKAGGGRAFLGYGSPFHKLPFVLTDEKLIAQLEQGDVEARLTCLSNSAIDIEVAVYGENPARHWRAVMVLSDSVGFVSFGAGLVLQAEAAEQDEELPGAGTSGRFGTRRMEMTAIDFVGDQDQSRLVYSIGSQFQVHMRYRVNDPDFDENAEVVMAFQRDGLQVTNRFYLNEYRFSAQVRREGEIRLNASPLLLAPGEYIASIAIHAAGHATHKVPRDHFAVSNSVYDMYYRCFHITVFEAYHTTLLKDVVFQHPVTWLVDSQEYQKTVVTD